MILRPVVQQRPAAIAPLTALLMTLLIAMVAFTVDVAWIVAARSELQTAADAAALAGADPLMDGYVQYQLAVAGGQTSAQLSTILTNAENSAIAKAQLYAGYNNSGNVNGLTLNTSDIQFGFTDASGNYTSPYSGFPNTIKVTMRRDSSANGALSLFFAPVLGTTSANLQAAAGATIYGGTANNLSVSTQNVGMLPVTYDVNAWNNFLKTGQAPDGSTSLAANGAPQLQVYPSVKDTGNFGQLSLDDSHAGDSTEVGWVNNGMSASDVSALQNANLIPLSAHSPTAWDWVGDTGFKASLVMDINNYTNKVFLIPLFTPYNSSDSSYSAGTGNGSHYYYNIVQFVGVRIMPVSDTNRQVVVQPAANVDPTIVFSGATVPAGTTSSTMTTFTYPKLTR
jgi:Flp pilus assembly protein TadG